MNPGESVSYYLTSQGKAVFSPSFFAFYSCQIILSPRRITLQKCRVLLYLGNSISFFVDKVDYVSYDFDYRHGR
jgi:hypothetical protein